MEGKHSQSTDVINQLTHKMKEGREGRKEKRTGGWVEGRKEERKEEKRN